MKNIVPATIAAAMAAALLFGTTVVGAAPQQARLTGVCQATDVHLVDDWWTSPGDYVFRVWSRTGANVQLYAEGVPITHAIAVAPGSASMIVLQPGQLGGTRRVQAVAVDGYLIGRTVTFLPRRPCR